MTVITSRNIHLLLIVLLVFLYVFYPPFTARSTLLFLAIVAAGYALLHKDSFIRFIQNWQILKYVIVLTIAQIYPLIVSAVNGAALSDLKVLARDFLYLGVYAVCICFLISELARKEQITTSQFNRILLVVGNLQGFFAVVSFLVPSFHNWVLGRFIAYGYDAEAYTSLSYYRLYGLGFHLTNYTPMVMALLVVLALYLSIDRAKYLLYLPLMLVSIVLNSRTAIVLVAVGFMLVLLSSITNLRRIVNILIIIGSLSLVAAVGVTFILSQSNTWYGGWVKYGFETIVNFFSGSRMGYAGYITKDNVWALPSGWELLFGCGESTPSASQFIGTDVGYVNYIRNGGLILLCIVVYINYLLVKPLFVRKDTRLFALAIVVFLLVGNVKDIMFCANEFLLLMVLLFVVSVTAGQNGEFWANLEGSAGNE